MRKPAQQYKVDFDGNTATGAIGQTVTSSLGDAVRFVKRSHYEDHAGRQVDTLLVKINGTPGTLLYRGLHYQGRVHNDFEILTQN